MPTRSPSVFSVASSSSSGSFSPSASPPPAKRKKPNPAPKAKAKSVWKVKAEIHDAGLADIEDLGPSVSRPHGRGYHDVSQVVDLQQDLLHWFEQVREQRGMPWRKRYDHSLSMEAKGQRAYEIWVSEVMLQQTQVNTVIAYWKRWIERWPTIADLANADVEEVNAAWRGLGYYRRARSLLSGAKTVMGDSKYQGRLPSDPAQLEKEVDGIGKYTAGAISSMAYGKRAALVDGNVHRLFTRLLALHAPQTAPSTIKFLWQAAEELVDRLPRGQGREGVAGDWNQALMELGSQVCKPVGPDCAACPLQRGCKAYAETSAKPPAPESAACDLCEPIAATRETDLIPSVTVFPMKKEKKASREEEEAVCVIEWVPDDHKDEERRWLFIKRPDKGLLAGLFEPLSTPVAVKANEAARAEASQDAVRQLLVLDEDQQAEATAGIRSISSISHIFSHINMTYHVQHLILRANSSERPPDIRSGAAQGRDVVWLDKDGVEHANIGTGVKKVWAEVYGAWGRFDATGNARSVKSGTKPLQKNGSKRSSSTFETTKGKPASAPNGEKMKKVVMMPAMPAKIKAGPKEA